MEIFILFQSMCIAGLVSLYILKDIAYRDLKTHAKLADNIVAQWYAEGQIHLEGYRLVRDKEFQDRPDRRYH